MRCSMTVGRPIRIGVAIFSSTTTCTARSTRSSSPSAKISRFFSGATRRALVKIGFIIVPL